MTLELDYLVVGAGVTGTAVARALALRRPGSRIAVLEKEPAVAAHASGRSSGVVHAGYNQKPDSLKARLCVEGARRIKEYCQARGVPFAETGILVVARAQSETPVLEELLRRAGANGVPRARLLSGRELPSLEPNVRGAAAFHAPSGASVDAAAFVRALAEDARGAGVRFLLGEGLIGVEATAAGVRARTPSRELLARRFVNCAGAYADRIAHRLGAGMRYSIVPFRGEFYYIDRSKAGLIRSMVYGAPDLAYPFLGVHWTRTVHGDVKVGPNAVLAFGREAYSVLQVQPGDAAAMAVDPRFWKMLAGAEFRRLALENLRTSLTKGAFLRQAFALVAGAQERDFRKGPAGIRAQVVDETGRLVDDLLIEERGPALHVLNAVSPGLTCSLPFAELLADRLL